ncbi:succinylglutamate desuccinylase [Paraglaciecola hydrolytica]|uniref:Succinylglutamate desuccinylase n=1 Tax=Paraglaciecola hydrolytica TaxID=1799789 RepID=A0A136A0N0_9ALTE|nr:succinylglutamate desuccinylase [Paraglaciecola hydrolytica]KXI28785.1 succinylglutamate desuccinylase [Paraglaciecola hydrolytica]
MLNHSVQQNKELITLLKSTGKFLQLSRMQPEYFSQSLEFVLDNQTKVLITAPGIICFEPCLTQGKDIVLSSGVHGNETAPIEICEQYVEQIIREEIVLANRVLFLFGNLPAMDVGKRFIDENMNRLFSGAHSDNSQPVNTERLRAKQLEEAVSAFYQSASQSKQRIHYDLHTAIKPSKNDKFAVYPFRHGKPWNKAELQFLLACGINTILLSGSATTTFSYYSSNTFGADAFTVELGKVKPFGQNDMGQFSAVIRSLKALICGASLELKPFDNSDFLIYQVNQVINKCSDAFRFTFSDDAANFSDFPKNYVLANDGEIEYRCQYDGEAIVFPNANVALGQRAVLTVIPTTI